MSDGVREALDDVQLLDQMYNSCKNSSTVINYSDYLTVTIIDG